MSETVVHMKFGLDSILCHLKDSLSLCVMCFPSFRLFTISASNEFGWNVLQFSIKCDIFARAIMSSQSSGKSSDGIMR